MWSQTNVFLNKSGKTHMRGVWEDLENEMAIRRNIRRKPPYDRIRNDGLLDARSNQLLRELYVKLRPSMYETHPRFRSTNGCVRLANFTSGDSGLDWSPSGTYWSTMLYDFGMRYGALPDADRLE